MKNLFLLLMTVISFTACEKEDDLTYTGTVEIASTGIVNTYNNENDMYEITYIARVVNVSGADARGFVRFYFDTGEEFDSETKIVKYNGEQVNYTVTFEKSYMMYHNDLKDAKFIYK